MERLSITHGMPVADARGKTLGIVEYCGTEHIKFRRGFFIHRRFFAVALKDVASLEEGAVRLRDGAPVLSPEQPDLISGIHQGVVPFQRALLENQAH